MSQPNLTPEFIVTFRDVMMQGVAVETKTTRKVIAAVPATTTAQILKLAPPKNSPGTSPPRT